MTGLHAPSQSGRLLVCGGVLIDDLVFADGRRLEGILGGAGIYALAGAALWHDDAVLVSGAGADADQHLLPWMDGAELSAEALRLDGAHTPRNHLVYHPDGTRTETPVYGAEHFERLQPRAADIADLLTDGGGAYVFRDADPEFWAELASAAQARRASLMWEISSEICTPSHREAIGRAARRAAALSINLDEAHAIFGLRPPQELFQALRALGAGLTFLRCGGDGSFVITTDEVIRATALPAEVIDVTGAGNAYGGAALAALMLGADPIGASQMGAIAARFAIAQHGPFAPRDRFLRAEAWTCLEAEMSKARDTVVLNNVPA